MIRTFLAFGLSALMAVAGAGKTPASGPVHVSGYTTKNGTVVQPYYRRAPGTAGSTYTAPTVHIYSSCADARAAGRWNILPTDSDWSASLDRDNDGIACEAGSDGSSSGRDSDPAGTVNTVSSAPTPWGLVGQTYPEWLGDHLAWTPNNLLCTGTGQSYEQAFLGDGTGTTPAWRGTLGFLAPMPVAADTQRVDTANTENNVSVSSAWLTAGGITARQAWLSGSSETRYAVEMRPMGEAQAVVCITTLAKR